MTTPKPPTEKACYGVMCPQHANCQRYHAVNGAPQGTKFIGTCSETGESRPLFLVKVPS